MKDQANPDATIAFLCPYPFFFYTFESVIKYIPNAEIVPDFSNTNKKREQYIPEKDRLRNFLTLKSVPWRDVELSGLTPNEFFSKYSVIVSPNYFGTWISHPANRDKKKARIAYGNAKDIWSFGLWNAHFDLICCPGPYYANGLRKYYSANIIETGEPKLDALADDSKINDSVATLKSKLDNAKQTILVLSTWGPLSILPVLTPHLIRLTEKYNVIVKVHHVTYAYEKDQLQLFGGTTVQIYNDELNICAALRVADVVISDNSSAIFDAIFAGVPIVLIDGVEKNENPQMVETPFYQGKMNNNLYDPTRTYSGAIEQIIKMPGKEIAPIVKASGVNGLTIEYELLIKAIADAHNKKYLARQRACSEMCANTPDGKAGERVAQHIKELVHSSPHHDELLELLVDGYTKLITDGREKREQETNELNQSLHSKWEMIKRLPFLPRVYAVLNEFFT